MECFTECLETDGVTWIPTGCLEQVICFHCLPGFAVDRAMKFTDDIHGYPMDIHIIRGHSALAQGWGGGSTL